MRSFRLNILLLIAIFTAPVCFAQNTPFYNEIQQFKQQDSLLMPPTKAILFTGSSSFRLWQGLQDSFPRHTIINRAFGGSSLPHLIFYANDVILLYRAKQIVIYCGDNDLASSDTVQPVHVLQSFVQLFNLIRGANRRTHIACVSIKPSISRRQLMPKAEEANKLISSFLKKKRRTAFIDVYKPMLLSNGQPDPSLFVSDNLHMNSKGYGIWKKVIEPYLKS